MSLSSLAKELYSRLSGEFLLPKVFFAFLIHAILLDQAFAHCPRFLTAGSKPGPYLSSSVADHPLRPTKHHRLGELLPLLKILRKSDGHEENNPTT